MTDRQRQRLIADVDDILDSLWIHLESLMEPQTTRDTIQKSFLEVLKHCNNQKERNRQVQKWLALIPDDDIDDNHGIKQEVKRRLKV